MKLFRKKKEEKKPEIEQQEVVQEVVEKAEEEFKTIKEQKADEGNIRQKAIELTAKRILQIFKDSPRYMQYVQDIAKNLAEESELPTEVVVEMIKGTIEQEELPNSIAEKMAQTLPDEKIVDTIENSDDLKLKHKEILATGIGDKETRLEVEKDIKTQKEIEEEQRIIAKLEEIYETCNATPEVIVIEEVKSLKIKNKTEEIDKLLNKILAKRIAIDFYDYGNPMLNSLAKLIPVQDMYEYNMADLVEDEFNQLLENRTQKPHKKYSKREFEDTLLKYMAKDVAKRYQKTSRFIIPQDIKRFKTIDKRQKGVFISSLEEETGKQLKKMQLADIEAQMQGIYGINEDLDNLEEEISKVPKTKASNIIKLASKMTNENDRDYNTVMALQESGVLEDLVRMPRDKREKYIEAFANFVNDKERKNQQKSNVLNKQEKVTKQNEKEI